MNLRGKFALVTGGSRGIGRGIVLKLAEEGVSVAIGYHKNDAAAKETLERARQHGVDGFVIQADVSRPAEVQRMFGEVRARFRRLDIFVANARPELPDFYRGPMDLTLENWDVALDSQAKAFLVGAREAAGLMTVGGRIIAITYSPAVRTGTWQPFVAMGSAKAAMETLCRYFAVTLARRGITVNAVSPGLTDDSVFNGLPAEVQDIGRKWHASGWTPAGRMGTPADIGNFVALVCADEASWLTGQVIAVDGGASLVDTLLPLEIQRG